MTRRLKHWGWGYEDEQPSAQELRQAASFLSERLGFGSPDPEQPVPLHCVSLPPARLHPPKSLERLCSQDPYERALHSYGRSYSDIVRAFRGRFDHPPDVVARLNAEINKIVTQPDFRARLRDEGADVTPITVEQTAAFVKAESAKYLQIIKQSGVKPE